MIKKERLEELIQKRVTIWVANKYCYAYSVDLDINYIGIADGKDSLFTLDYSINDKGETVLIDYLEYLFETKEDAEEYAEFGNITRTERLELPTWASIEKDFDKFTNGSYVLAERDEFSLELKISKPLISEIIIYTEDDDYNWNLSRENYNKARRLCVKFFKGEK